MLFKRTTVIANAVHEMVHPRRHAWMMMAAGTVHFEFVLHDERLSPSAHASLEPHHKQNRQDTKKQTK
jgi:hypothetical protein